MLEIKYHKIKPEEALEVVSLATRLGYRSELGNFLMHAMASLAEGQDATIFFEKVAGINAPIRIEN